MPYRFCYLSRNSQQTVFLWVILFGDQKLLDKSLLASAAAQVGVAMPGERLTRRNLFNRAQVRLIRNDLGAAVCWLRGNVETSFCFLGCFLTFQVI